MAETTAPEGDEKPAQAPAEADDEPTETESSVSAATAPVTGQPVRRSKFSFFKTKKGKITLASVAGVVLVAAVLCIVPATRYAILGMLVHKDVPLSVVDSKTGKPVTDADVSIGSVNAKTDSEGKVTLGKVAVGQYKLTVKKKNYKDASVDVTVPVLSAANAGEVKLEATGRQVPLTVTNRISGQPLAKVTVTAGDATGITDAKGELTLVVPANLTTVKATLKADGYNDQQVDVTVTEQKDPKNALALTPAGKVYFLSKRTGKINVMKSDLDGANQEVVLAGTGKEDDQGTVMLASRDWKYLALLARRDSDKPKLYLISTSNDKLSTVDEGDASFTLTGWSGHTFVYRVFRDKVPLNQPKREALKTYDADGAKIVTIDETQGEGNLNWSYATESINTVNLLDTTIVYTKEWYPYNYNASAKQNIIVSVQPNGANKKVVKQFNAQTSGIANAVLYKPGELYFAVFENGIDKYYEYDDGVVKAANGIGYETFYSFYPTFLVSPNGQQAFWYEQRDGKNVLFVGDKNGENGKELGALSDYVAYGWYTDDYLLLSKNKSELYIMPANGGDVTKALKVTDYHKPALSFFGYGYGYGGF